jgi:FemAB-related protein (PEP-CTERM system-associated)
MKAGWRKVLKSTYRYPCYFLLARAQNQILGVMPLFQVKSPLFGHRLETLPGALCVETPEVARKLICEADALARQLNVDTLIMRDSRKDWTTTLQGLNFEVMEAHRGVRRSLNGDPESIWKSLNRKFRQDVKRIQRNESIRTELGESGLEDFYRVFFKFTHKIGTPLFGISFLRTISEVMAEKYQISRVYHKEIPVAGYYDFLMGKTIFGFWGGRLHDYRDLNIPKLAYWLTIKWGCQNGYATYDLGRSPYPSGQFDFKQRIGDEEYPIFQIFRSYKGKPPIGLMIHTSEKDMDGFSQSQKMWQKVPRPIARFLGPKVRWHIPFG